MYLLAIRLIEFTYEIVVNYDFELLASSYSCKSFCVMFPPPRRKGHLR